ncbi:MAG: cobalt-precorrin 5A hydrolase [Firmicutes bacterium]|nr:cobalt-precorrin 5A hydrolase [Bacillota bacterium]
MNGAIVAITPRGRELALDVGMKTGFAVYLPDALLEATDLATPFSGLRETLSSLFSTKKKLLLIMATGIAIRMLAPYLESKQSDPAVVVLDEGGHFAISLLSGHMGGANELAHHIATITGATPVITTATDVSGLRAVDVIAYELGLTVEPFNRVKEYNAAMLRGTTVAVYSDLPVHVFGDLSGLAILPLANLAHQSTEYPYRAVVTNKRELAGLGQDDLMLRPPNLHVGVGCRRGVSAERLNAAIEEVFSKHNLSTTCIAQLASIDVKQDEVGLLAVAQERNVPIRFFSAQEIRAADISCKTSAFVEKKMGVGAVCVPTAMLAAQSKKLLVSKQQLKQITIAVAEAEFPWLASDRETSHY